jgi:hypothetical protein
VTDFPDDAVVVRGGLMNLVDVYRSVMFEYDETGRYGLSVSCLAGMTTDALAALAAIPNAKIRVSTVARVQAVGCEVIHDPLPGYPAHALVTFEQEPSERQLVALTDAFDAPVANPAI